MVAIGLVAAASLLAVHLMNNKGLVGPSNIRLDGIIVTFKPGTQKEEMEAVAKAIGGSLGFVDEYSHTASIDIPPQKSEHDIVELILRVENIPTVEFAKPSIVYEPT
jgi:hypothetical protein